MSASVANQVYGMHCCTNFDADAAAAAFRRQRGFTNGGLLRNGAGDYTLTMSDALDIANGAGLMFASTNGGAAAMIDVVAATATTLRVRTMSNAAMAADIDFCLAVFDIGPN